LKVGVLSALTGWFSTLDTLMWHETELAADMVNERGGVTVNGQKYKIQVVVSDIQSTMDGTTSATNKLIHQDGVKFIVGPSAFFSSATTAVAEPAKVLRILSFCTMQPGELDKTTPFAFLGFAGAVEHAVAAMTYLHKNYPEVKTITLIAPDDGGIPYFTPPIKAALAERGITVLGDTIGFPNEMVDFSPIAAKIVAAKADAVMQCNGIAEQAGAILKGIREAGYDKPYAFTGSASCEDVMAVAGKAAATNFFDVAFSPGIPGATTQMNELSKRVIAKFGDVGSMHFETANGIWELPQVIQKAQSLDTTVVRDTFEKMDTIETLFGVGHLGGLQTYGLRHSVSHPLPVTTLINGVVASGGWVDFTVP
jgi:branched-chain amino acid transport system substrate-binding protein